MGYQRNVNIICFRKHQNYTHQN